MESEVLLTDKKVPKALSCVYWEYINVPQTWVLGAWRVISLLCLPGFDCPVRETDRQRDHNARKNKVRLIISFRKKVLSEETEWRFDGKAASQRPWCWKLERLIYYCLSWWNVSQFSGRLSGETHLSHTLKHALGRGVIGGAENPPNFSWHLSHLDELGYLSIRLCLVSKATVRMNLPFLVPSRANSSFCPERWRESLRSPSQGDKSYLMRMTLIHLWAILMTRGRIMTHFPFSQTRNFAPNWFLMRSERY